MKSTTTIVRRITASIRRAATLLGRTDTCCTLTDLSGEQVMVRLLDATASFKPIRQPMQTHA